MDNGAVTHVLTLRPAVRTVQRRGRLGRLREVPLAHYLDLLVDGRPLSGLVRHGTGLVTALQPEWVDTVLPLVDDLLGRPDVRLPSGFAPLRRLDPDRVPLLVSPWDDDIRDGWLTARVDVGAATVSWRQFRWENGGIGTPGPVQGLPESLVFARSEYTATLETARAAIGQLPVAAPDRDSWRDDEPVPGVPVGWERAWGRWARLRHGRIES